MPDFMLLLADPNAWISLATLTALEIVLGVDNLIFISVLVDRLPPSQRDRARQLGIGFALISRLALLFALSWIIGLTTEVFSVFGKTFSWRDLILITGGLFLLWKATAEIHEAVDGDHLDAESRAEAHTPSGHGMMMIIGQIAILDVIFSLDSVITAVGMVDQLAIMVTAVVIAVMVMLVASGPLARFIGRFPTLKMLAFSFLLLVGMTLVADGFGFHIPKGYIYAAMGFSIFVESMNLMARERKKKST